MEALYLTNERLKSLLATIDSQDGVITDEQEEELQSAILQEAEGIPQAALAVKEIEEHAEGLKETRKRWWEAATNKIKALEHRAGRIRSLMTEAMSLSASKSIRSHDKGVLVSLRQPGNGRLEVDSGAVGKIVTVYGYELEDVLGNSIPLSCFKEKTIFVLDKSKLREHLDAGNEVVGARIVKEPTVTIRIAG